MKISLKEGDVLVRRDGETEEVVETLVITRIQNGNVFCIDPEDDRPKETILIGDNFDDDDLFELNGFPL